MKKQVKWITKNRIKNGRKIKTKKEIAEGFLRFAKGEGLEFVK